MNIRLSPLFPELQEMDVTQAGACLVTQAASLIGQRSSFILKDRRGSVGKFIQLNIIYFIFHTCSKCKSVNVPFVGPSSHAHPNTVCYKNSSDDGILIKMHWKTASVSAFSMSGAEGRERWGCDLWPKASFSGLPGLGPRQPQECRTLGEGVVLDVLASPSPSQAQSGVHCRLHPVSLSPACPCHLNWELLHLMTLP